MTIESTLLQMDFSDGSYTRTFWKFENKLKHCFQHAKKTFLPPKRIIIIIFPKFFSLDCIKYYFTLIISSNIQATIWFFFFY